MRPLPDPRDPRRNLGPVPIGGFGGYELAYSAYPTGIRPVAAAWAPEDGGSGTAFDQVVRQGALMPPMGTRLTDPESGRTAGFRNASRVGRAMQRERQGLREERQFNPAEDPADALLGPEYATPDDLRRYDYVSRPSEDGDPSQFVVQGKRDSADPVPYFTVDVNTRSRDGSWRAPKTSVMNRNSLVKAYRQGKLTMAPEGAPQNLLGYLDRDGESIAIYKAPGSEQGAFEKDVFLVGAPTAGGEPLITRIDPTVLTGEIRVSNADQLHPNEWPVTLGQKVQELLNEHKTPVVSREGLTQAFRDGRFIAPGEGAPENLVGFLRRTVAVPVREGAEDGPLPVAAGKIAPRQKAPRVVMRQEEVPIYRFKSFNSDGEGEFRKDVFRVGNPLNRNLDQVVQGVLDTGVLDAGTIDPITALQRQSRGPFMTQVDINRAVQAGASELPADENPYGVKVLDIPGQGPVALVPEVVTRGGQRVLRDGQTIPTGRHMAVPMSELDAKGIAYGPALALDPGSRRWIASPRAADLNPDGMDTADVLRELAAGSQIKDTGSLGNAPELVVQLAREKGIPLEALAKNSTQLEELQRAALSIDNRTPRVAQANLLGFADAVANGVPATTLSNAELLMQATAADGAGQLQRLSPAGLRRQKLMYGEAALGELSPLPRGATEQQVQARELLDRRRQALLDGLRVISAPVAGDAPLVSRQLGLPVEAGDAAAVTSGAGPWVAPDSRGGRVIAGSWSDLVDGDTEASPFGTGYRVINPTERSVSAPLDVIKDLVTPYVGDPRQAEYLADVAIRTSADGSPESVVRRAAELVAPPVRSFGDPRVDAPVVRSSDRDRVYQLQRRSRPVMPAERTADVAEAYRAALANTQPKVSLTRADVEPSQLQGLQTDLEALEGLRNLRAVQGWDRVSRGLQGPIRAEMTPAAPSTLNWPEIRSDGPFIGPSAPPDRGPERVVQGLIPGIATGAIGSLDAPLLPEQQRERDYWIRRGNLDRLIQQRQADAVADLQRIRRPNAGMTQMGIDFSAGRRSILRP